MESSLPCDITNAVARHCNLAEFGAGLLSCISWLAAPRPFPAVGHGSRDTLPQPGRARSPRANRSAVVHLIVAPQVLFVDRLELKYPSPGVCTIRIPAAIAALEVMGDGSDIKQRAIVAGVRETARSSAPLHSLPASSGYYLAVLWRGNRAASSSRLVVSVFIMAR